MVGSCAYRRPGSSRGVGPTGDAHDLERADDPAPVGGQDGGRRPAGRLRQPGVHRRRAVRRQLGLELGADRGIRTGEDEVVEHRPHVQRRAADEHRHDTAGQAVGDDVAGQGLELRHRGRLGDVEHVQQVVADTAAVGGRQLGGADVHAPVELHRVGVDHLAAEPLRERDRQPRLAGRRRPDDGDHGWQARRSRLGSLQCARPTNPTRRQSTVGFLDKLKKQATTAADKHGDKIVGGIDKAGDAVNKATKNKYAHQVSKAAAKAKDGVNKAGGAGGAGGPGGPGTAP